MQNLTVLERRARRQCNDAIWAAYAKGISYTPWSPIDFTGWEWV